MAILVLCFILVYIVESLCSYFNELSFNFQSFVPIALINMNFLREKCIKIKESNNQFELILQ